MQIQPIEERINELAHLQKTLIDDVETRACPSDYHEHCDCDVCQQWELIEDIENEIQRMLFWLRHAQPGGDVDAL